MAAPQPKAEPLRAPRWVAVSRNLGGVSLWQFDVPEEAAFGLEGCVDVGDVDIPGAGVGEVGDGDVHAFVGVAADGAEALA